MKQKFIEWFTKNNNGCSPAMEDDRSFVREKTQHMFEAYQAGVAEGEARCAALSAENAGDTSMEITRYRVYNGDENVEQYDEGAYVIYEDAMEIINDLSRRLRSVSAENILLKSAHPQPFGPVMMKALDAYEKHQDETPETGMLDAFFILRDSIRADTTATDAFLAEVRAQGKIEGAESALQLVFAGGSVQACREYISQLRKGVQS
ncbi:MULTISPECIES: hypothetical protein [Enterobacter]|uniref:hypothetical protein n=1 Tax=Enterobacter TaxID=547 RepID=UPI00208E4EB0|nr:MULTISPECIES: hypothetical protein [Enterobacter]